jgi:DNA replication protein DnaC
MDDLDALLDPLDPIPGQKLLPPPVELMKRALADTFGAFFNGERFECLTCKERGGWWNDPRTGERVRRPAPETDPLYFLCWDAGTNNADGTVTYRNLTRCWDCDEEEEHQQAITRNARETIARVIPPLFEDKGFGDFTVPPGDAVALFAVKNFRHQARGGRSLYLWSAGSGCGKSHLAFALAKREIHAGRRVAAIEWTDFLGKLKASWTKRVGAPTEDQVESALEGVDVLVLDDVGAGKMSEWAAEKLWGIVNARYIAQRQVVITANFPPLQPGTTPDLARVLGAGGKRTASRLLSMCDVIQVHGGDRRLVQEPQRPIPQVLPFATAPGNEPPPPGDEDAPPG